MLSAGEGLFIAAGKTATLKAGNRKAIDLPPLLPCPGCGLGLACRDQHLPP